MRPAEPIAVARLAAVPVIVVALLASILAVVEPSAVFNVATATVVSVSFTDPAPSTVLEVVTAIAVRSDKDTESTSPEATVILFAVPLKSGLVVAFMLPRVNVATESPTVPAHATVILPVAVPPNVTAPPVSVTVNVVAGVVSSSLLLSPALDCPSPSTSPILPWASFTEVVSVSPVVLVTELATDPEIAPSIRSFSRSSATTCIDAILLRTAMTSSPPFVTASPIDLVRFVTTVAVSSANASTFA